MRTIYGGTVTMAATMVLLTACGGGARDTAMAAGGTGQSKLDDQAKGKESKSAISKFFSVGPKTGTLVAGSEFSIRLADRVCTTRNPVGSTVNAKVSEPVSGSNGVTVAVGNPVTLRITESARSQNSKSNVRLAFALGSVMINGESYTVPASVTRISGLELVRAQSTEKQAEKIGAGAAIGAIAGQILGKNTKSTVTGAVVGAAAGTAVAIGTADYDGCLAVSSNLKVTLTEPLQVKIGG